METRAHYVAIGSFTLLVIAAAFAFVFWFRGTDGRGTTTNYRIVFTGSVSGLAKGSLVMYNGLKVGEVTSLSLMPDDPSRVVAVATVAFPGASLASGALFDKASAVGGSVGQTPGTFGF